MAGVVLSGMIIALTLCNENLFVDASCPRMARDAEARAKECLTSVGLGMEPMAGGGQSEHPQRLKQYCQDGTLEEAVACVENIVEECQREKGEVGDLLSQAVSVQKLRSGFHYLCQHIDTLSDHRGCIEDQTQPISKCIRVETTKFQTELQTRRKSGATDPDDVWSMSCRFMDRVQICQDTSYRQNCGQPVADVLQSFMQSVKPPKCSEYSSTCPAVPCSLGLLCVTLFVMAAQRVI